jgi:hypothetical protein
VEYYWSRLDRNTTPSMPALETTFRSAGADLSTRINSAGRLTFRTSEQHGEVTFVPLNSLLDRRYPV